jgi:hypothetical protein
MLSGAWGAARAVLIPWLVLSVLETTIAFVILLGVVLRPLSVSRDDEPLAATK